MEFDENNSGDIGEYVSSTSTITLTLIPHVIMWICGYVLLQT